MDEGWMDGWRDRWKDGWIEGWVGVKMSEWKGDRLRGEWKDRRIDRRKDGNIDGFKDRWKEVEFN